MNSLISYEVSKPFPKPNPAPGAEQALADLNAGFFDVLCYFNGIASHEKAMWKKGPLRYGIFVKNYIPFFIIDFPKDGINLDMPINILKINNQDQMDAWLNSEANTINLFLINSANNILEAARFISISIAEQIRDVLEEQTNVYSDQAEVDKATAEITNTYTTNLMIQNCKMITI